MSIFERIAQTISRFLYQLTGDDMFRVRQRRLPRWLDGPVQRTSYWVEHNQRTIQELRGLVYVFLLFFIIFIVTMLQRRITEGREE